MLNWLSGEEQGSSPYVPFHKKPGSFFAHKIVESSEISETKVTDITAENEEAKFLSEIAECHLSSNMFEPKRKWRFRVRANTFPGESVGVVGNCDSLGNWKSSEMFHLSLESEDIWSGEVYIPLQRDVEFRYAVCVLIPPDNDRVTDTVVVVRHWETHMIPRVIRKKASSNIEEATLHEPDDYGFHNLMRKVESGWLTKNTVIQLKMYNRAIVFWKRKLEKKKVFVKVSPVNLVRRQSLDIYPSTDSVDESMDTQENPESNVRWPITEIAVMNEDERTFKTQDQFGHVFNEDEFLIFNINVLFPESVAYLVDFYVYHSNCQEGEPPYHVGFSYLLPSALKTTEGQTVLPITSVQHRPIGQLTFEYIVVRPIEGHECDMSISYAHTWKDTWLGLDVGHRGSGTSFKNEPKGCADIRENTIASLKQAASSGADFVEFDVQLSKDMIPVLYHDFHVCIAMKRKKHLEEHDMLELPLKDLTLDQLHLLKGLATFTGLSKILHFTDGDTLEVYHVAEKTNGDRYFSNEDEEEHQPFPTLQQALEVIDPHVGFNIEIKWSMQLQDGSFELYQPFELNLFLDTVLKVVLNHSGHRKIVFSCFHPDVCTMIRLKQNKFPVIFLTQGVTSKYPAYLDPRAHTIQSAIHFAISAGILGINVHTEDILRDSTQVKLAKDAGLVIFCWGDDNNDVDTIKCLKKLGLHGIIYDKIDQYSNKEVKESIFLVEAREAQKELLKVAESPAEKEVVSPILPSTDYVFNLDVARQNVSLLSTASSLSVWDKSSTLSDVSGNASGSENETNNTVDKLGEGKVT